LGWLDFLEGKIPEALEALRAIWTDAKDKLAIEHIGPVAAYHTHVANAAGEIEEARQIARTAVAHWRETEDRVDSLGLLAAACEVLPAGEAKPVLAELEAAEDAGAPIAAALVPYARAWVAKGATASVPAFREAAEKFAGTGMEWWSARALMLAGENGARNQAAVDDLLEARRRFREIEAFGWRARCEAELRARGHRFVMASRHSEENLLSAREIEVLECVAAGLTNREIAERLYISEKTAGHHLERIYGKLGVTSRTAAVTAAVERGLVSDPDHHGLAEKGAADSGRLSGLERADIPTRM
jgi:DNA-binding CsgD family transcriptional regulator